MVYEMAEENKSGLINKINLLSTQLNIHKQWVDFKNPFKFEWTSSLWIGIFQRATLVLVDTTAAPALHIVGQ